MQWPHPISIRNQLPPAGDHVLALEQGIGWWQAQHFPADDGSDQNDGVAGWEFVGDDADVGRKPVTHWMPLPPVPGLDS